MSLVLNVEREREAGISLGNMFRQLDPALRVIARSVVFRGSSQEMDLAIGDDARLRQLLAGKQVGVLRPRALEEGGFSMSFTSVKGFAPITDLEVHDVRGSELGTLLDYSGAVFKKDEAHFVLPSGAHAAAFVRIAELMRDHLMVRILADWLSPWIQHGTAIVSDTGDLLPLLYELRLRSVSDLGWDLPFVTLAGYPFSASEVIEALQALRPRVQPDGSFLLLVSVNSSERLAYMFKELAGNSAFAIAVCHTRNERSGALDDALVLRPIARWEAGVTERCSRCVNLKRIYVDRRTLTFTPEQTFEAVRPAIADYTKNAAFWTAVSRTDAVRLHANAPYGHGLDGEIRHHAVYLDVVRLLDNLEFRSTAATVLAQVGSPDLVLVPEHVATESLCQLVKDVVPNAQIRALSGFERVSADLAQEIRQADHIAVVDDVIVTGATVFGIKQEIYRLCQDGRQPELSCFVVVARPESPRVLQNIENPFRSHEDQAPRFFHAGQVFLPLARRLPSGNTVCPWCDELRLLNEFRLRLGAIPSREIQAALEERIRVLEGEIEAPFLLDTADRLAVDELVAGLPGELATVGSFFGNLREKAGFAAATSVAHELGLQIASKQEPFHVQIADLPFFVSSFFDGVLIAGFLRTFEIQHVRRAVYESRPPDLPVVTR